MIWTVCHHTKCEFLLTVLLSFSKIGGDLPAVYQLVTTLFSCCLFYVLVFVFLLLLFGLFLITGA